MKEKIGFKKVLLEGSINNNICSAPALQGDKTPLHSLPVVPVAETLKPPKPDVFVKISKVRPLGVGNEAAEALKPLGGLFKKVLLPLAWVGALTYVGADVVDKYKNGTDGKGTDKGLKAATRTLVFQSLASILLPTQIIHLTTKLSKPFVEKGAKKLAEQMTAKNAPKVLKALARKIPKLTNASTLKSLGLAGVGIATLALIMKPLDCLVEKGVEKMVDPLLGIKHSEHLKEHLKG